MNDFKKRLIIELSITVIVVTALLAGILFFKGNVDNYLTRITQTRALLASRTQALNNLALLQRQYNTNVQSDLDMLQNIVPPYDSLVNLNAELQSLAMPYKLGYGFSFAGQTEPNGNNLGSLGYNLTLTSSNLSDLLAFLKALTNFHDLSSIDNVSVHSSGGQLNLTVSGRVYYR
jgi:hypothetical protein